MITARPQILTFVLRNLLRRPLRNGLTAAGIALAMAIIVALLAFGNGYRRALSRELDRSGMQMMLVPLGCPYDAAARVLKNNALEVSLPAAALEQVRSDPAVAVAAPILMAAVPRPAEGRTDLWVGIDEAALQLKPWWKAKTGESWFTSSNSVMPGAEAASVEMRAVGDKLFSPETGRSFRVGGILERSGTSDDSVFFIPLRTAQAMFNQPERLTAISIRLHDPALMREASERLQRIPGAQVITLTEMTGTFLNLLGAVHTLTLSVTMIALTVSVLSVFNTLLAGVIERTKELTILRALGASRAQVFVLLTTEALLLTAIGAGAGFILSFAIGPGVEAVVKHFVPLVSNDRLLIITSGTLLQCALIAIASGVAAAIYPAWRASLLQPSEATKFV